jgi:hypothetical protein
LTSENPPLNLAGAALVPGLGKVKIDRLVIFDYYTGYVWQEFLLR